MVFLVLPVIRGDMAVLGYHSVKINNYVTNINDYPNHVFVVSGHGLCLQYIGLLQESGNVPQFSKNCQATIYAVEKTEYNLHIIDNIENETDYYKTQTDPNKANYSIIRNIFESLSKTEAIKNVISEKQIPDSISLEEEDRYYSIDLNQVKEEPDKTDRRGGYFKELLYALLSSIALIIIMIIVRRKQ